MSGLTVADLTQNSRVQMAEVVAGLVAGRKLRDISETTGVPADRIRRWVQDEHDGFMELLAEVEEAVVEHLKDELVAEVAQAIDRLTPKAIAVLEKSMEEGSISQRTTAAAHVLRFAGYGRIARADSPRVPIEEVLKGKATGASPRSGD